MPSMPSPRCQILKSSFVQWLYTFSNTYYDLASQSGQSTITVGKASFILRLADITMHSYVRISLLHRPFLHNIITYLQRFSRGLGAFVYTALLKISASPKMHIIFGHISANWIIKTFCDAAHSYFNIQQSTTSSVYYRLAAQCDGTGFWLEPCSNFSENPTVYARNQNTVFKHLSARPSSKIILDKEQPSLNWIGTDYHSQWVSFWSSFQSLPEM